MSSEPRQRTLTQLQPHDVIEWKSQFDGSIRRWVVHGIHLGGLGQESVIAIEALDRSPAWNGIYMPILHVPECLLRQQTRIAGRVDNLSKVGDPPAPGEGR